MRMWMKSVVLGVALSAALPAFAAKRVDVVKVMSFSCQVCAASEAIDGAVQLETTKVGGRFIPAPLPTRDEDSGYKERFYFAARNVDAGFGERVKKAIYRSVQERGISVDSEANMLSMLQQELPNDVALYDKAFLGAREKASADSVGKAYLLSQQVGATDTPTYIYLVNGELSGSTSAKDVGGSMTQLRQAITDMIKKLSK